MVSLVKSLKVSLEKKSLQAVYAKVALVIDATGSMSRQYKTGKVQKVIERVVPLAVHFDDDATLESWMFARQSYRMPDITLMNVNDLVSRECNTSYKRGGALIGGKPTGEIMLRFYIIWDGKPLRQR
ncbi:MAG: VWA domain-containing protein [Candidatus Xenobiia bacterium LiM19]